MYEAFNHMLGRRLRAVRQGRRLTLQQVEDLSGGTWSMARIGSYERGERAMSAPDLLDLADLYRVPASTLLPGQPMSQTYAEPSIDIDVAALAQLPDHTAGPLAAYARTIQQQREGPNRHRLRLGPGGVRLVASIYHTTVEELVARLIDWGVVKDLDRTHPDGVAAL